MNKDFAFGKENFIWIGIAIVCIISGFALMSGGGSTDGISFNPAIFSKQRIVVAPIVTMVGFILMVYGILKGGKRQENE
jgi:spore maturation protein SpmA